jgi:hypothetical protein
MDGAIPATSGGSADGTPLGARIHPLVAILTPPIYSGFAGAAGR